MTTTSFKSILGILCENKCTEELVQWNGVVNIKKRDKFFITNAVMANAIEYSELLFLDKFGRIKPASDGGPNDKESKAFALNAFEDYIVFTRRDSPYEIPDEHPFFEDTPLNSFGWKANSLPDFSKINLNNVTCKKTSENTTVKAPSLDKNITTPLAITNKVKQRRDALTSIIEQAIEEAGCYECADVFLKLKELALDETPPFTGICDKNGLEYINTINDRTSLKKSALGQRLRRLKNTSDLGIVV
jgi:hypothetical protein